MYLTDEELCMLEQLTYLDEDVAIAAGINKFFSKINMKDHGEHSIDYILSYFDDKALAMLALHNESVCDAEISGTEWVRIISYIKNSRLSELKLVDLYTTDNRYHAAIKNEKGEYVEISDYLSDNPDAIISDSDLIKYPLGLCFTFDGSDEAIIAYKGTTGQGEWGDNVAAASEYATMPQIKALDFANKMAESYSQITVTGHSKGANKAMFATILCDSITRCVCIDGEGFSVDFLANYDTRKYDPGESISDPNRLKNIPNSEETIRRIAERAHLITNYSLSNDFVHILLNQLPGSHQIYLQGYGVDNAKENHSPNSIFMVNNETPLITILVNDVELTNRLMSNERLITALSFIEYEIYGHKTVEGLGDNEYDRVQFWEIFCNASYIYGRDFFSLIDLEDDYDSIYQKIIDYCNDDFAMQNKYGHYMPVFRETDEHPGTSTLHDLAAYLLSLGDDGKETLDFVQNFLQYHFLPSDDNGYKVDKEIVEFLIQNRDNFYKTVAHIALYAKYNDIDSDEIEEILSSFGANENGLLTWIIGKTAQYILDTLSLNKTLGEHIFDLILISASMPIAKYFLTNPIPFAIASHITELVENNELFQKLINGGVEKIQNLCLEYSGQQFYNYNRDTSSIDENVMDYITLTQFMRELIDYTKFDNANPKDLRNYVLEVGKKYTDGMMGENAVFADSSQIFQIMRAGDGNDVVYGMDRTDIIFGGNGKDSIHGLGDDDLIIGDLGSEYSGSDDILIGGSGNDIIFGNGGNDRIFGDEDNDLLFGDGGDDEIYGGTGNDRIYGGEGKDTICGDSGDDWIYGGNDDDIIIAGSGTDHVWGDDGNDEIYGSSGYNYLFGGKDNDTITGGIETDNIWGEDDNDTIDGSFGDDTIFGGHGDDTLDGGYGTDYLYGGDGCDTYIIAKYRHQNYIIDSYGCNFLDFIDIRPSEFEYAYSDSIEDALDIRSIDGSSVYTILQFTESYDKFILNFFSTFDSYEFEINQGKVGLKKLPFEFEFEMDDLDSLWGKVRNKSKEYNASKYLKAEKAQPPRDPLVIDLSGNGSSSNEGLVNTDNGVYFDLDNNGFAEKTAWIDNGKGFLAYDRNGNGIIDNGSELFGDSVIMSNGQKSAHGFEALADLDSNNDGIIDENDTEFNKLLVWQDTLRNGKTDTGELKTLEELGIKSISLTTENKNHTTESGTIITDSAEVRFTDNRTAEIAEHWFEAHSYDTQEPNIEGDGVSLTSFGNMPSLSNALAADESGELNLLIENFKNADDFAEKRIITKKILYFITGANEILSDSRGGAVDARDLHVIEAIMGVDRFIGSDGNTTPNSNAAPVLKELYVQFENLYLSLLDDELDGTGYIEYLEEKVDENGNIVIDSEYIDITIKNAAMHGNNIERMIFSIGSYLKTYDKACGTNCFGAFKERYTEYADTLETVINADSVLGTSGDDILNGTNSNEIFWGDSGNDTINAGGGNDFIYGGEGNNVLNGGLGNDTYYFGKNHGNDVVNDNSGETKLVFTGGASAEDYNTGISVSGNQIGFTLTNKETGDTIFLPDFISMPINYKMTFEDPTATLGGGETQEIINGTSENDYLEAGDGFNVFYGGDGEDTIAGGANIDIMYGGENNDTLLGRNGTNIMYGEGGNDTIYDGDDSSYLSGGEGNDELYGGGGADVLDGGAGNDYLQGDHGNDTYIFGKGYDIDTINASSGNNTIIIHNYRASSMINTRNAHNDLIINFVSADSTDCLIVDHFFDYNSNRDFNFVFDDGTVLGQYDITAKYAPIYGTDGDDWLAIQNGDNGIIHGGTGNDGLSGGSGNDELYGEGEDDTLYGNDGNDILDGGTGNDTLCGGNGTDTYIFAKGYGNDTINEWGSDHSIVKLTDINSDEVTITDQWGSNLVVSINETEDTLIISNFKWGQATYSFEFADGAIASVNKDTWELEFSKLPDIPETSEDELVQYNADILSELYTDDSLTSDLLTEPNSTVISDIPDSVSVNEDSDEVADQTDIQVMILTENMSAFADEDNVFDNTDILDSTDDISMMNQLLVGSQVQ